MKKTVLSLLGFMASLSWGAMPPGYSVVSASPHATRAGMQILKAGGNAFDAAVAVSAALGVTEPYHSSIGGGGFWLLFDAKNNKNVLVDGREVAPLAAFKTMYLDKQGEPIKDLSLLGPLASAIPGEPAALAHIAKKYGVLPLSQSLEPAINLAAHGFPVDELYRRMVMNKRLHAYFMKTPSTASIFAPSGKTPKVGELIVQKDLAKTLRIFAKQGHKGFYEGPIASKLVSEVRKNGGIWRLSDLKDYHIIERAPLEGTYKSVKIITTPAPSAGGLSLITMLNLLSHYPLHELPEAKRIHLIVEAMRLAYWDRAEFLGDPDFVTIPMKQLTSLSHANDLRQFIKKDKATLSSALKRKEADFNDTSHNTTHFSIIDAKGNRVSATLSVNFLFGSNFVVKGTGVLLNDQMDDFSVKPGVKNVFGLVGGESNSIAPKKRPLSSMAPTFLVSPSRIALLGTPGGSRIPTMLLLSTLSFVEGKNPVSFVSQPRYHHQYLPDVIQYENDAFSLKTQKELLAMGYRIESLTQDYGGRSYFYGDMQAIEWNMTHDALIASSDPRHIGLAEVHYD